LNLTSVEILTELEKLYGALLVIQRRDGNIVMKLKQEIQRVSGEKRDKAIEVFKPKLSQENLAKVGTNKCLIPMAGTQLPTLTMDLKRTTVEIQE